MTRIFLAVYTLLFLGFGIYAVLSPDRLSELLGMAELSQNAAYELRSNYGGVSLGIGLMCLAGALRANLERPALFVLLAYTGGYALGRIAALPFDGLPPSTSLMAYGVFEAVTALLSALLLSRRQSGEL